MNLSACIVTYNDREEALRAAASVLEHTRRHPPDPLSGGQRQPRRHRRCPPPGRPGRPPGPRRGADGPGDLPGEKRRLRRGAQHRPARACQRLPLHPQPRHPAAGGHPVRPGGMDGGNPRGGDGPAGPLLPRRAHPGAAPAAVQPAGHGVPPAGLSEIPEKVQRCLCDGGGGFIQTPADRVLHRQLFGGENLRLPGPPGASTRATSCMWRTPT